jgi:hypothetical protein
MSQPSIFWWQKYGTLAQMAQATVALLGFGAMKSKAEPAYLDTYSIDTQQWVKASMKTAGVTPPDCKLGKT